MPVLGTALLGLAQLNTFQTGAYQDDAWYIALATALANGQGYVRSWTPLLNPEILIPVGFPALLAPIRMLFPDSFVPLQLFSLAASIGTVALCIGYYRKRLGEPWAGLFLLLLAVHVAFVRFSTLVMQEALYTALSILVIVLVDRQSRPGRDTAASYLVIGLLATGAYFARAWGIALVVALALWYGSKRSWLGLFAVIAPFSLSFLIWSARNNALGGVGASYGVGPTTLIPFLQALAQDLPSNAAIQWFQNLPDFLVPLLFGPKVLGLLGGFGLAPISYMAGGVVLALLFTGYLRQARKEPSLAEYYIPLYLAILTLAPHDARYWVPMTPLLILCLGQGAKAIVPWITNKFGVPQVASVVIGLGLVTLISLHLARDVQAVVDPVRNRIPDVSIGPAWLAANAPPTAVLMAQVPRVSYLYTARPIVPFPDLGSEHYDAYPGLGGKGATVRFAAAVDLYGVDYILVEPRLAAGLPFAWHPYVGGQIVPYLEQNAGRFKIVFTDKDGLIRIYNVLD